MNRSILVLFCVLLILAGCSRPNESYKTNIEEVKLNEDKGENGIVTIDKSIDSSVTLEATQENKSNGEIKAVKDAQEFIEIIKEKDADKLIQLLNTTQLDIEGAKKIIQGFDVNFDLDILSVQINYDGFAMNPQVGQYEFILVDKNLNENNKENSLVIRYDVDGSKVYDNPYVRYFPYAEEMVLQYLDHISKGKATELAGFLNPDDIEVPSWVAEKTIMNYENFFDSGDLSIRYTNRFVFVAEDGIGNEHVIEVNHGDGLMSIKDDFIPEFLN